MPRLLAILCAGLCAAALGVPAGAAADTRATATESLRDIYRQARTADPQVRGQRYQLEELRAQRRETFGGLLPQITASGSVSRVRRDQTSTSLGGEDEEITRDFTLERYQVNLVQPLYDLGAARRLDSADRIVHRGEYELEAAEQALIARVAERYLEVLSAQSNLELARREAEAIAASFERIEGMHAEGAADITELEQIRARLDSARAAALRAESDLSVAREELAELTGHRHERLARLRADIDLPAIEPADIDTWTARAREQNPHVRAAAAGAEATRHELRAARGERAPRVDLSAGYSLLDELDGTRFGREFEDITIGIQIDIPLYSGGSASARQRGIDHRRARELEELEQTRRTVRTQVRGAFLSLASARNEIRAQEQAVRSNERNVEAMEARFEAGRRPVVDLIDAQRDLFAARRDLAALRHSYLIDTLTLKSGAGILDEGDVRALDRMFTAAE